LRRAPDIRALVAGVVLLVIGGVVMLDAVDAIRLSFAVFAPIACAATGAILLANGLSRSE
jgi:hypothetical protein